MKKLAALFIIVACCRSAFAQSLTPEEAARRVGDSIRVCGKIFGGKFFETSNNSPTLLDMGAAYPASPLTIMIPGNVRSGLGYIPEASLKEKTICVRGRVTLFKSKPEIIIYNKSQLEITE